MDKLQKGIQNNKIYVVHFHGANDGESYDFSQKFVDSAEKVNGILQYAFVNCSDQKALCKKHAPKDLPALKVYPPTPMPAVVFPLDIKKAVNKALRYIPNFTTALNDDNYLKFINTNPTVPKALFFSNKKSVPLAFKALSSSFKGKLSFGFVYQGDEEKDQTEIPDHFGVRKYPSLVVYKDEKSKKDLFKGEMKFRPMFEFLNVYSQQFVPENVGGDETKKPWKFQPVPEMHGKSVSDVCLKVGKGICVIVFTDENELKKDLENDLKELKTKFDKGRLAFRFMWAKLSHTEWRNTMELEETGR